MKFEEEERGNLVSLLDMIMWTTTSGLELWRKDPNALWTLGQEATPEKIRYPAFLGPGVISRRKMKAWLRGAWHAETQKTADIARRQAGTLRVVGELLLNRVSGDTDQTSYWIYPAPADEKV